MASAGVDLQAIAEQLSQVLLGFQNEREPNLVISVYLARITPLEYQLAVLSSV